MKKRILVVEDDHNIQDIVVEVLKAESYEVDRANNGQEAFALFKENSYDLVITDVMMPVIDGYQLVKMIRNNDKLVKIVMLTALSDEFDEIKGFELGIDDYISKPFSFNILTKRVAVLLKSSVPQVSEELAIDNIKLVEEAHQVYVDGSKIDLTLKEFKILKILMENVEKVVSREHLLNEVWGYSYFGDTRVIDTHIKNIRQKTKTKKIKTVTGIGYKIEK